MRVIGIDPGVTGAIAVADHRSRPEVFDLEAASIGSTKQLNPLSLINVLVAWGEVDAVFMEDNRANSVNGSKANYSMGLSMGIIIGVCAALGRPLHRVRPVEWQGTFRLGKLSPAARKHAHRQRAQELWPDLADSLSRVKDHNRADALLIAEHGRRTL